MAFYTSTGGAGWTNHTNWLYSNTPADWYGVTVTQIGGVGHVTQLTLPTNNLIGEIPDLTNLPNLSGLYLQDNQISGSIPATLGNLTGLIYVNLSKNHLSGTIPPKLADLTNLSQLYLQENQLSGTIPDTLGNLTSLSQLYLQENQLSGIIPETMGSLTGLTYLDLSKNLLTGGIPTTFGALVNLISLYLTNNQLEGSIPDLPNLTKLKQLALSFNHLNGAIPASLGQLANLEWLLLYDNNLSGTIPASLGHLSKLTRLELGYNPLLSGSLPPELGNIPTLQILIVSNTGLSERIPDPAFTNLNALFLFKFSGTLICEPDSATFTTWKASVATWDSTGLLCNYPDGIPVSGTITDSSGAPLDGVTFSVLGPDEKTVPLVLDGNGQYLLNVKYFGTYQLTPSRISTTFYPDTLTIQVNSARTNQNFLARAVTCYAPGQPNGLPCSNQTAAPFLQLPFILPDGTNVDQALQDADYTGGLVTSWFDQSAPGAPASITPYDGESYTTHLTAGLLPGAVCYNRHCATALRGIGLKSPQPATTTNVFPAADGTITEICATVGACPRGNTLGRYLVIQHKGGLYATLYANLSTLAGNLTVKNDVTTGTPIGTLAPGSQTLYFMVFFNGSHANPWTPNAAEAVDPFGWRPYDERADGWPMPSVPLWKNFHLTLSEAPETYASVLSSGGVTVSNVINSQPNALLAGNILTLADSSLGTLLAPGLRSVGRAFHVKILDSNNWTMVQTSAPGFTLQVDFSGANFTHLDQTGLSLYQLVGSTWAPVTTTFAANIASATIYPSGKFTMAAPLLCPSDTREPYNDTADRYKNGSVWNLGAPWDSFLDTPADQDWVAVDMIAGATYDFTITPGATNIDLVLTLYAPDGSSTLVTHDPALGQPAHIQWKAQSTGIHYLRVSQSAGSAANCSPYQIVETDTEKHIFLPMIAR